MIKPGGELLILTNTRQQIRNRQLYAFFPGLLEYNLARFRSLSELSTSLRAAGFQLRAVKTIKRAKRSIGLEDLSRLATGGSDSAFWTLSVGQWNAGLQRLEAAIRAGQTILQSRNRVLIIARRQ